MESLGYGKYTKEQSIKQGNIVEGLWSSDYRGKEKRERSAQPTSHSNKDERQEMYAGRVLKHLVEFKSVLL